MPRRSLHTDDQILDGVGRAVARVGLSALRLRDVSDEVGLAPPTLVQRFGSKQGLLDAFARRRARTGADGFADDGRGNPLKVLEKRLLRDLGDADDPRVLAHHEARLQAELADPALHAEVARHARRRRKAMRKLLDRAVAEGRLERGTSTARLARTLEATVHGARTTWTIHRKKSLKRWVRREIRAVLAPHRTP